MKEGDKKEIDGVTLEVEDGKIWMYSSADEREWEERKTYEIVSSEDGLYANPSDALIIPEATYDSYEELVAAYKPELDLYGIDFDSLPDAE